MAARGRIDVDPIDEFVEQQSTGVVNGVGSAPQSLDPPLHPVNQFHAEEHCLEGAPGSFGSVLRPPAS